jgi:Sigma-70 region 2
LDRRPDDVLTDEAYELWRNARSREARAVALTNLLRAAEPFIGRVVRHFSRGALRDLDREEALQQARLGFIDAVGRSDPARGPLRPFAMMRIRHELQSLAEVSYGIKVPRRSGVPAHVLRDAERIWSREGREPTSVELNGHAAAYAEAATRPRVVTSFDALGEDRGSLADVLGTDDVSALDALVQHESSSSVTSKLSVITRALEPSSRKVPPMDASVSPSSTNVLDGLRRAIREVQAHIKTIEDQERALRQQREGIQRELAALAGAAPASAPRSIIELGQDSLTHKVMRFLRAHPNSRVAAIASAIGASPDDTSAELAKLRTKGTILSRGKARGTTYSPSKLSGQSAAKK